MINFTRTFYGVALLLAVISPKKNVAQCVFTSTDGYTVSVKATPVSVIAPSNCPDGYNYNLKVNYQVVFSGSNIPANLWTLQGNIICAGTPNFFSIPTTGGSGSVNSVSNPYKNITDCASATVSSLGCTSYNIVIQGPGINTQTSTCPAGGILPINLISFNAKLINSNTVYLKWVTANEVSNKSFTIERSTDARNWQAIKTINGSVNSSTNIQYDHADENLAVGMYYYRLKQTDVSGAISYSNVIGANVTKAVTAEIAITNSTPNQLYITGLKNYSEWESTFINTTGSVMARSALSSNTVSINNLSAGIYIIKLSNKMTGTDKVIKFIKN